MTDPAGFEAIRSMTSCVFAPSSTTLVCELPSLDDPSFPAALRRAAEAFLSSNEQGPSLDGWVIALPEDAGSTIRRLAATVNRLLRSLAASVAEGDDCFAVPVEHPGWRYQLADCVLHVLAFGSCYGTHSSRYAFGAPGTYVLLQPDQAFARRVPPGGHTIPASMQQLIAERYAAAGRPYDAGLSASPFQAHKFVKPLEIGDPVVRWWEA